MLIKRLKQLAQVGHENINKTRIILFSCRLLVHVAMKS